MTRKVFLRDVAAAASQSIPNVVSVVRGDDDGDVNFCFIPDSGEPVEVGLLVTDVGGYPSDSPYMIFTKSDNAPKAVTETLEQYVPEFGINIPDLIIAISQKLSEALSTGTRKNPVNLEDEDEVMEVASDSNEQEDEEEEEEEDDDEDDDDDDNFSDHSDDFSDYHDTFSGARISSEKSYNITPEFAKQFNKRIRSDIKTLRMAGFRFGILNGMKADSYNSLLSISIQISKLGLSEEAIQAWDLEADQYIVLLIRYTEGYKTFDDIIAKPANANGIQFRVGVSNRYKPSPAEALSAFSDAARKHDQNESAGSSAKSGKGTPAGFFGIFIGNSLNQFFNEQMISLLKIRHADATASWEAAKDFFDKRQGQPLQANAEFILPDIKENVALSTSRVTRGVMAADHLRDGSAGNLSFPLIAMQFALKYLVHCTEFCLVCHKKTKGDFGALKPYVCEDPLCLYQYMSLGFGPSVEHELQVQPYVVDLLVSFCYMSAQLARLREYPTGMSLAVPPVATALAPQPPLTHLNSFRNPPKVEPVAPSTMPKTFKVMFDKGRSELLFNHSKDPVTPVHIGDWVAITTGDVFERATVMHFRVENSHLYPTVKLSETAVRQVQAQSDDKPKMMVVPATPADTPPPTSFVPASMIIYNANFDDMNEQEKRTTIMTLIETLPSVMEMRQYVKTQSLVREPTLRAWSDRISPAALGLLRWIIASNRSCLVQVDKCPGQDATAADVKIRPEQKVSNIPTNWVQFRFAQGSPDKEQRFLNALKSKQGSLNPKYPTLFAFHGSPLGNWHSIIRHGLDFKETLHGRAYGHGVYHAQDQHTSTGYSAGATQGLNWPSSALMMTAVMSINEIVNCPSEYASSSPYLVVQHIDWIQCRYLLVQLQNGELAPNSIVSVDRSEVEQDPTRLATSLINKPIGVPQCAASVSRAFRILEGSMKHQYTTSPRKKQKLPKPLLDPKLESLSEDDDIDDIAFLLSDDENESNVKGQKSPHTDFVPGSLDQSRLPMLAPPAYATSVATMRLNRELQTILKVQESTPLHELGWYIDSELVSNVYQWIVELHSLDAELPLAKDLKAANLTSVVLEIRFGKEYPISPPFVRVVRPRFLPFMEGGGGHVTAGGALCMELLTNTGWSAVSSIESVLLQVRLALMSVDPKPARLQDRGRGGQSDYTTSEAMSAFIRACQNHGWQVPKDFQDFATGSGGY